MKKIVFILFFIPLVIFGQISGTVHDFGGDNKCFICHEGNIRSSLVYKLYSSPSLDACLMQPLEGSVECLNCHSGTNSQLSIRQYANFGTDLSTHHPISFIYDDALVYKDGELHDVARVSDLLKDGRVECVSCHDIHGSGSQKLLRRSNHRSALCLCCHKK